MKEFTFPAWCNFGSGDYGETEVVMDLTDEEADLLVHWGTNKEVYYDKFSRCKELHDIYKKVYDAAVSQITEEIRDCGDYKCPRSKKWKADQLFECGVNFPRSFEKILK